MNLGILYFVLYLLSFVFSTLGWIFLFNYSGFQDKRLKKGVNSYLIGLGLFVLFVLIRSLYYGKYFVQSVFPKDYAVFSNVVEYLLTVSNLTITILISMFYLASVILFRDAENIKLKGKP